MKNVRLERINSEIQKALSYILDNDLRDPQIDAMVNVHEVSITPDLSYCRVYITSIGTTPSEEVLARVKGAAGFIRSRLSQKVKLRITPRLEFIYDSREDYSHKIDTILKGITYSTQEEDNDE